MIVVLQILSVPLVAAMAAALVVAALIHWIASDDDFDNDETFIEKAVRLARQSTIKR